MLTVAIGIGALLLLFVLLATVRIRIAKSEREIINAKTRHILHKFHNKKDIEMMTKIKPKIQALHKKYKEPEKVKHKVNSFGLGGFFEKLYEILIDEVLIETVLSIDHCWRKGIKKDKLEAGKTWERNFLEAHVPIHNIADLVYHFRDNRPDPLSLAEEGWDMVFAKKVQKILVYAEEVE